MVAEFLTHDRVMQAPGTVTRRGRLADPAAARRLQGHDHGRADIVTHHPTR